MWYGPSAVRAVCGTSAVLTKLAVRNCVDWWTYIVCGIEQLKKKILNKNINEINIILCVLLLTRKINNKYKSCYIYNKYISTYSLNNINNIK